MGKIVESGNSNPNKWPALDQGDPDAKAMLIALAAQHGLRLTDLPPPERCARRAMAAKLLLRRRRQRDEAFPKDLFADPAWDMLLDLYAAQQLERPPIAVSSLCIASSVPPTTALRWIRTLESEGLVRRTKDPADGRRIFISLTDLATHKMDKLIGEWIAEESGP